VIGVVVSAEIEFGEDVRGIGTRDVIGDEIDEGNEPIPVATIEEVAELHEAIGRIPGVIGGDIEVIPDGVGAAGEAFEEVGRIGRPFWVGCAAGVLKHAGEPEVGESEVLDRS